MPQKMAPPKESSSSSGEGPPMTVELEVEAVTLKRVPLAGDVKVPPCPPGARVVPSTTWHKWVQQQHHSSATTNATAARVVQLQCVLYSIVTCHLVVLSSSVQWAIMACVPCDVFVLRAVAKRHAASGHAVSKKLGATMTSTSAPWHSPVSSKHHHHHHADCTFTCSTTIMTATTSVAPHIQLLVVVTLVTLLQLLGVRAEVISCPTIPLGVSECRHGAFTPSLYLAQDESCYFSAPVGSTKVVGYLSITLHGHNTIYIVGRVSITVGEIKRCSSFCSSNTDRLTFVGTGFGGARRSSTSDATCHGGATGGGSSVGNGGGTSSVLSASSTPVELAWWQDLLSVIGNAGSAGMGGCEAATNVAVSNAGKGGARLQLIVNDEITAKRLDFHFDGCTVPADGTAALAGAQAIGGGGGGWVRLNMVALAATTQVYISARGSDGWRSDAAAASGSVAGGGSGGFVGLVLAASAASRVASPFLASEDKAGLTVHYNITGGRTVGGGSDDVVVEGSSGVAAVMFWSLTSQTVQLDLGPAANATNAFAASDARSVTNTTFAPQREVYLAAPKLGVAGDPTLSVMVGDPMGVRIRPCTYEDRAGCLAAALSNPRLQDVHVYDGGVVSLDDVTDTPLALSGALQLRSGGILVLGPQVELHAAEVSAVDPGSLILLQGNSTLRRVGGGNGGISVSSGAVLACGGLSSSGQDAPCTVSDMLLTKAALAVVGLSASLVVEDTLQAANTSTAIIMWPRARLQAQTLLMTGAVVVSPQLATYGLVATIPMREREYWACAGHPQCANATQWEEHFTIQAPLLRTNVLTAMLAMPGIMLLIGRHGTAAIEGRITAFATPQPHTMRAPLLCTSGPLGGTHSGVGGGGVSSDACASWGATHRNRLAPAQWGQQLAATSPLQGAGGGFVRIHGYTLTIDGQVSVRGGTGHGPASCDGAIPALRGAGGAGGTIQILAHTLTGRGSLDASGGAAGHSCNTESADAVGGGAGGGGGGALQVYMEAAVEPHCPGNLTCTAVGGAGTSSELDGGGGEIVVKTSKAVGVVGFVSNVWQLTLLLPCTQTQHWLTACSQMSLSHLMAPCGTKTLRQRQPCVPASSLPTTCCGRP